MSFSSAASTGSPASSERPTPDFGAPSSPAEYDSVVHAVPVALPSVAKRTSVECSSSSPSGSKSSALTIEIETAPVSLFFSRVGPSSPVSAASPIATAAPIKTIAIPATESRLRGEDATVACRHRAPGRWSPRRSTRQRDDFRHPHHRRRARRIGSRVAARRGGRPRATVRNARRRRHDAGARHRRLAEMVCSNSFRSDDAEQQRRRPAPCRKCARWAR